DVGKQDSVITEQQPRRGQAKSTRHAAPAAGGVVSGAGTESIAGSKTGKLGRSVRATHAAAAREHQKVLLNGRQQPIARAEIRGGLVWLGFDRLIRYRFAAGKIGGT